jgi:hypothetical protein
MKKKNVAKEDPIETVTETYKLIYESLLKKGFTGDQAFKLLLVFIETV